MSLDGRIASTVPALIFRPGKVTRAYLDGKRARFVPPFRLFLISGLIFFGVLFFMGDQAGWTKGLHIVPNGEGGFDLAQSQEGDIEGERPEFIREDGTIDRLRLLEAISDGGEPNEETEAAVDRAVQVYEHQDEFFNEIEKWAPRLSLLIFPILTFVLALLFVWRRSIYIYDHVITAIHFQSWLYLFSTLIFVLCFWVSPIFAFAFMLAPQYCLYRTLRTVYDSGRILAFVRMNVILFTIIILLALLTTGLIAIGAVAASGTALNWSG